MSSGAAELSAGRDLLCSLKVAAGNPGPQVSLTVGKPPKAILRVVATGPDRLNGDDIRCLTEWRNRFVTAFLTEFVATDAQTRRWLMDVIGPDDTKILFMADTPDGRTFGYLGLAFIDWKRGCGEADAVVRGGPAEPGTMSAALKTLLAWARLGLGLTEVGVRVRSDNPALNFYRKLGFGERYRTPLRRTESPDKTVWIEDSRLGAASPALVHLHWLAQLDPIP